MNKLRMLWKIIRKKPSYLASVVVLALFAFMSIFGPLFYPHGVPGDPTNLYAPPSWKWPLGTDYAGNSIFAQIVLGARFVLAVAVLAALFTMFIGVALGVMSGFFGGVVDSIIMRVTDFVLTLPSYPLLIIVAATVPISGPIPMALLLSLNSWGGLARAIRSQVLSLKKQDYIEAARVLRLGGGHIAFRHILPLMMPYIIMHLILAVTGAVYGETGLFFLGIVPIETTNWGVMLNYAYSQAGAIYSTSSIFYLAAPLGAILLLQTSSVTFSDALNDFFNPQLQSGYAD